MKILNVYFKNINSLAGVSRIDFDKSPIADAGVFAITGPNGSGKTSILDAITLALYGETFRFNKPAENVMTRDTARCFAHVEFLVNGEKYRSSWQVKRQDDAPEGQVMAAQMQLLHLGEDEEVLENQGHKVIQKMSELTGMDFRRFTRSIMLAQGDFAAFLNALDSERLDVLERIISSDIYADHKQGIDKQKQRAERQLSRLKVRLASSALLSDAQREAAEADLDDQQLSFTEFKQERTALLQLQSRFQALQAMDKKSEQLTRKQTQDQQKLVNAQTGLDIISESGGQELPFKEGLQESAQVSTAIEQAEQQQSTYQQSLQQVQDKLEAGQADESYLASLSKPESGAQQQKLLGLRQQNEQLQLTIKSEAALINACEVQLPEKQQTLSMVDTWLAGHQKDQSLVENMPELGRLKNLRSQSIEIQKALKTYNKTHKNNSTTFDKVQARLASSEKDLTAGKKSLTALQKEMEHIADGHTFDEMLLLHEEQRRRVADCVELLALAKVHKKLAKKGESKRYVHLNKEQLEKQIADKNKQVEAAQGIQGFLEKAVYREQLTIKLTEDRHKLEDKYECSLCGSLDHPYAKSLPVLNDSQKALAEQNVVMKGLNTESKALNQQLEAYTKVSDKNIAYTEGVNRMQTEWLTLCTRLNVKSSGFDMSSFKAMKTLIKNEKKQNNEINVLIQRFQSQKKEIAKLDVSLIKKQAALERLQAKKQVLDESGLGQPQEALELESNLSDNMQAENSLSQTISAQLTEVGEKLPATGREDKLYDVLSKRRQDYQSYLLRQKSVQTEIQALSDKVVASSEQLQMQGQEQQRIDNLIAEQGLAQLYFSQLDIKQQLNELAQSKTQFVTQLAQVDEKLQLQLKQSPYDSLASVQQALDLYARKDELSATAQALQQQLEKSVAEIEALAQQLTAERVHMPADTSLEEVLIQLREKTVQMDIVAQERTTLEKTLAEQEHLQAENQQTLDNIEQQQTLVQQLDQEQQQITAEPETVFRRRVQMQMAEQLLAATNTFLDKVNGRYHVASVASDLGLAIEIIDNKHANQSRALKSLSGGETFVVSLAMALGLSEIANNGRAVDSLFIDEGFGNLDAETLYTVVSTLEALKAQGKTVGVISHVEGIKLSIKTQIELLKQPNGLSRIVVPEVLEQVEPI